MMRRPIPRPALAGTLLAPDVAHVQDGVFTRAQARAAGFGDTEQRRLLRRSQWVPLAGHVIHPSDLEIGPWQRARAVDLLGRIVSHSTAAAVWGLQGDEALHGIRTHGTRVRWIVDHRPDLRSGDVQGVGGLSITSPLRMLTDVLCTTAEDESVTIVTDALRRRLITTSDLHAAARAARGRTGVARVRAMAESCVGEPWSWLEWRFQSAARAVGAGWRFNAPIDLPDGSAHVVDALHVGTGTIVELDGKHFHGQDRFQADRSRDQRLAAAGYVVVRITWEDLAQRFDLVMRQLGQTIAVRERSVGPVVHQASAPAHRPSAHFLDRSAS